MNGDSPSTAEDEFFDALRRLHRAEGAPTPRALAEAIHVPGVDGVRVHQVLDGPDLPAWDLVVLVFTALTRDSTATLPVLREWRAGLHQLWVRANGGVAPVAPPDPEPSARPDPAEPGPARDSGPATPARPPAAPLHRAGDSLACPRHGTAELVCEVTAVPGERLSPQPAVRSPVVWLSLATLATVLGFTFVIAGAESAGRAAVWSGFAVLLASLPHWIRGLLCLARRTRVREGLPRAMEVWRAGYYCAHCDGVFFVDGRAPFVEGAVPPGRLLPVDAFQRLVWNAGGYADLGKPTATR